MTTIKIFLASSEELKHERLVIAEQVANMNRTLANQDITLRLVKWEYLDSSMGVQHKQEDYNDYLVDCDMCFALFWTRFGMYTEIEFEKSLKELNSNGNIRHLSVLFKESTTKSDELRAFEKKCTEEHPTLCHTFKDDDTLKDLFNAEVERFISENTHIDNEKDDEIESKSSIQTVRIFLSIDKTLEQERLELTDLVENLNHSLERRNANILMLAWDNSTNDSKDFKKEISKTDLCLNLYYTYFNNTTQAELESAYQALCEGKNPKKIYVYFKDGDTIPEKLQEFRDSFPTKYGHFYCSFSNIDTLKADFLLQFMEYQSKNLCASKMLEVNNGKVTLDGKEYVDLKNVPFAGNNEEYNLLLKSIKKTKKLLAITDEDDEEYADYAAELQELNEKLSKMENSLWDTALMITRLSTTKCSERLKRAMDLFNAGDNKGAQAVLNEEEIERDVEHNLHLIQLGEEGKKGLKINIEEYKLKIKTLENEMAEGWLHEQCKLYERVIELSSSLYGENSLEAAQAMMDATQSVYLLEDYKTLYKYIEKALAIRLEILGENHLDTAQCFNDLGVVSGKLGDNEKYLEYAKKGLEIRLALNAPGEILAESYNTAGAAMSHFGDNESFLEYQLKGLELRKATIGEQNIDTANSYSQVGIAYGAIENFEKYLEYSQHALEIMQKIAGEKHPDTGLFHNNVGDAYMCLEEYPEAIEHLQTALNINLKTKGKLKQSTLTSYENLSVAYELSGDYENALKNQIEAVHISDKVNKDTDSNNLKVYERAGKLFNKYGDNENALNYLYHALELRFALAKEEKLPNGPKPTFELADLCHEIGSVHFSMTKFEEAERMLNNAVNILSDIEDDAPELRDWTYHLGLAYARQNKHEDALASFKEALARRVKYYGGDHPDVVDAYRMVGHASMASGHKEMALESFNESLNILQRHLPEDHEDIIEIKQILAELNKNQ